MSVLLYQLYDKGVNRATVGAASSRCTVGAVIIWGKYAEKGLQHRCRKVKLPVVCCACISVRVRCFRVDVECLYFHRYYSARIGFVHRLIKQVTFR